MLPRKDNAFGSAARLPAGDPCPCASRRWTQGQNSQGGSVLSWWERAGSGGRVAQVHRAYNLNIWRPGGGFHDGAAEDDAYDTFVQLRLSSDEDETHATVREARTRIVDNCRSPEYNAEFEFLGERVSQRLQLAVVVTSALEHGRLHSSVMGRASVVLDDLARCPKGKVCAVCFPVVGWSLAARNSRSIRRAAMAHVRPALSLGASRCADSFFDLLDRSLRAPVPVEPHGYSRKVAV